MALTDIIEIPRKTMVIFFIIETSGRMAGDKIAAINTAIRELIPGIRELSDDNADTVIKIAVLQFSNGAKWLTPNGPVEADEFNWKNLDAKGNADLGSAFGALNEKLSLKAFLEDATSYCPPLFLFSDGKPTDDWQKELEQLKQNSWFRETYKIAIPISADADRDVLRAFTGTMELVFEDFNPSTCEKIICRCMMNPGVSASGVDD